MTNIAEQAAKLLEGTTPGPWRYRPHKYDDWGVVRGGVFNEEWGSYPPLAQVRDPKKLDDDTLSAHRVSGDDPWEANARLTAAAPDLARAVIAQTEELARLRADLAKAVEALEWYAEQARLARLIHSEGDVGRHAISNDGGQRARATLSEITE